MYLSSQLQQIQEKCIFQQLVDLIFKNFPFSVYHSTTPWSHWTKQIVQKLSIWEKNGCRQQYLDKNLVGHWFSIHYHKSFKIFNLFAVMWCLISFFETIDSSVILNFNTKLLMLKPWSINAWPRLRVKMAFI